MSKTENSMARFKIGIPMSIVAINLGGIISRFTSKFEHSNIYRLRTGDSIVFFVCSVLESDLEAARAFFEDEEEADVLP